MQLDVPLNRKQLASLWLGVTCFAGAGLFPPWVARMLLHERRVRMPAGFSFISTPVEGLWVEVDFQRLAVMWLIIIAITATLVVFFHTTGQE